jgi:hypothetical protein
VASADTLEGFLRDLRARFPETGALPAVQPPAREPGAAGANPPGATGRTAAAQ